MQPMKPRAGYEIELVGGKLDGKIIQVESLFPAIRFPVEPEDREALGVNDDITEMVEPTIEHLTYKRRVPDNHIHTRYDLVKE